MLELLEDLIGSSKFKPDIEILQNLVEDLDAQRAERLVRLNLAKKDLAKLEKPNEQAVAHLRQLNYIAQKTDLLCQLRVRADNRVEMLYHSSQSSCTLYSFNKDGITKGVGWHRGSVRASHPPAPGSILGHLSLMLLRLIDVT